MIVNLLSSKTGDIISESVVLLFLVLGILGGCTMDGTGPVGVEPILVSSVSSTDAPVLLAEQAYQDDNRLMIQFRCRTRLP